MAYEVTVPRLGWSMEEGTFVRWLKQDGDQVQVGEPLFELEGEKATQEIEAVESGILRIAPGAPQPGTVVPVGAVLGYLTVGGEPIPTAEASSAMAQTVSHLPVRSMQAIKPEPVASSPSIAATPRARRRAAQLQVDWSTLTGSGRGGRIRERDVMAAQRVERTINSPASTAALRRRTIAARLRTSLERTVPVTLTSQADATRLVRLRGELKSADEASAPSYTDMIAKLVATALAQHPALAQHWDGELLRPATAINIGIAVDTDDGLLVPVLRNVDRLSLPELASRSRELIDQARSGALAADDMQQGVFTISNLGSYGIDWFTPVINYPEIAILGLGAIRRTAVVADDGCQARDVISLSLTFDHAAVDGAPAARYLQAVCRAIEDPQACLPVSAS